MCSTTHELLEFCRDITHDIANATSRNNEDNFSYITGITEILSKRQDIISANKLSSVLQSEKKQFNNCV